MEIKNELKMKSKLSKLFFEVDRENRYSEEEIKSIPEVALMDKTNVIMIIAKTEESKILMVPFISKERMDNIPSLNYEKGHTSKYNVTYMIRLLQILEISFETCEISVAEEFPMTLENDSFRIILAPRVGNE